MISGVDAEKNVAVARALLQVDLRIGGRHAPVNHPT